MSTAGTSSKVGIGDWAKALNGTVIAGLAAVVTAQQDGKITAGEWLGVAGTLLGAFLLVAFIRNAEAGWRRYLKAILGGLAAFVGALATGAADGGWPPSSSQLIVAVLALLNALPVWWSPNASESDQFRFARRAM